MSRVRKNLVIIACISTALVMTGPPLYAGSHEGHGAKSGIPAPDQGEEGAYTPMPKPGEKVPFGDGRYLVFGFDRQPKMGTMILKIQVFNAQGKKDSTFVITADSGMPSMRGAHETGDRRLKLSKNGDYLIPIDIVMPGDWEVRIKVAKDGKVIFRGSHKFDV